MSVVDYILLSERKSKQKQQSPFRQNVKLAITMLVQHISQSFSHFLAVTVKIKDILHYSRQAVIWKLLG